jgi:hypothetical protein
MAPPRPVAMTRGAAGDPAATSDQPTLVVGYGRCWAQRLQRAGRAEAPGPAPVAKADGR